MLYQLNRWQHSTWKRNTRSYGLDLCQDLWGNWIVKRTWGSNLNRGAGQSKDIVCPDFESAQKLLLSQQQRRLKRGYTQINL